MTLNQSFLIGRFVAFLLVVRLFYADTQIQQIGMSLISLIDCRQEGVQRSHS